MCVCVFLSVFVCISVYIHVYMDISSVGLAE